MFNQSENFTPKVIEAEIMIYTKMYSGQPNFKYDGVIYDANRDLNEFIKKEEISMFSQREYFEPEDIEAAIKIYTKMYNGQSSFKYYGVIYDAIRDWYKFVKAVKLNRQKARRNNPNYHNNKNIAVPKKHTSLKPKFQPTYNSPTPKAVYPQSPYPKASYPRSSYPNVDKMSTMQKIALAGERGESNVEYQLEWLDSRYTKVARNCFYKDKQCIVLYDPLHTYESQEIDHIVVSDKNVFIIETKNYKGTLEIQKNGNWIRIDEDGKRHGSPSPVAQVDRHFKLLAHILKGLVPENKIRRLICISNPSAVIVGERNSPIPVVKYDMLERKIQEINASKSAPLPVSKILERIELYKVNKFN